jgi:Ca2+-binding EF-hand superfamily protein
MKKMINFLKNLFGIKKSEPSFIPQDDIQKYLVTLGFKLSTFNTNKLIKENDTHKIIYNMDDLSVSITRDGGTIVLKSFGNINKVKRFISKYSI